MVASRFANLLTRASVPKAGLGNLIVGGRTAGGRGPGPKVATRNVNWQSPGQPQILDQDIQQLGEDAYLNQVYVMRCCQAIAHTISGLPWRAGMDPSDPADHDPTAPLVQLLGESTPQAPGGPNPRTASRAFWAWSIIQYLVYGRFAWEAQLEGSGRNSLVVGLWPLVSACINAVPTQGGTKFFDSFVYTTPMTGDVTLREEQVIYAWRPSLTDWRVPETVLSAAKLPIYIAKGLDRYMVKLLQNDMVASTLVVTPPFDEPSARRAWQEQFLTSFSGVDNRGKTIFAEAEYDENDTSGKPLVQVEKIAQTAVDAQLLELSKTAKDEICVALGVPLSLIGNAQERIYANAASEYKNFWTMTVMNLIEELQDHVNTLLAPRLGTEVGWFDLSRVAALQPPQIFAPPMIPDIINYGIAGPAQIANVLGIPAADATSDADTDTVELGEESAGLGPSGINRWVKPEHIRAWNHVPVTGQQLINARLRFEQRPINSFNWEEPFIVQKWLRRDGPTRLTTRSIDAVEVPAAPAELPVHSKEAVMLEREVDRIRRRHEQAELERRSRQTAELVQSMESVRFQTAQERLARNIHGVLAQNYPESTLGWVMDANWAGPHTVKLQDIAGLDRRPGGRDPKKVKGITAAYAAGETGAMQPVVLVRTPTGVHKVADGYHRLAAHRSMGHKIVNAYVGQVPDEEGPWDREMHDKKLNRSLAQDNAAYQLGLDDQMQGRRKLSAEQFKAVHPHADADDYPLYVAGYKADRHDLHLALEPGPDERAWLPQGRPELTECVHCGGPAAGVNSQGGGVCAAHAVLDAEGTGDTKMFLNREDSQWLAENHEVLVALADAELDQAQAS